MSARILHYSLSLLRLKFNFNSVSRKLIQTIASYSPPLPIQQPPTSSSFPTPSTMEGYGTIQLSDETVTAEEKALFKEWLHSSHIYSCIIIYISYLHDQQLFNLMIRSFTQAIIYSIPDMQDLSEFNNLLDANDVQLQMTRISMILLVVLPYIFMNLVYSLIVHGKALYISLITLQSNIQSHPIISVDSLVTLLNKSTNETISNTHYFHSGLFIEIIGEKVASESEKSILICTCLLIMDIILLWLQLSAIQQLRQQTPVRSLAWPFSVSVRPVANNRVAELCN